MFVSSALVSFALCFAFGSLAQRDGVFTTAKAYPLPFTWLLFFFPSRAYGSPCFRFVSGVIQHNLTFSLSCRMRIGFPVLSNARLLNAELLMVGILKHAKLATKKG